MIKSSSLAGAFGAFLLLLAAQPAQAQRPDWIWNDNHGESIKTNEVRFFRKVFEITGKPEKGLLSVAADDDARVFLNGKAVARSQGWDKPDYVELEMKKGRNVLAIRAVNKIGDQAGVVLKLELKMEKRPSEFVVTDTSWLSAEKSATGWQEADFDGSSWTHAVSRGKLGDQPWGDVLHVPKATAAETLTTLPGFKAELLRSSEIGEGSWICMTIDDRGRLIVSPQADSQPLLRLTLSRSGKVSQVEKIAAPVHQAMGLLYANNSLYVNGHGQKGTGLYRLIDSNHNGRFDTNEVHFLKKFEGEGEHGYHAVVQGPDKKIYVMNGNHTRVPANLDPQSPHKNFQEDFLLARQWDPGGHAVGILAPGGYVVRTDADGKNWELMLAGFRNSYDFDFNADGEMFTYDSDMEWDWGLPWYRPTRINHCVMGAEFGWRSGTAVWPEYYPDSLPAAVNVGIGSPTGVKFGTKSRFPQNYRSAMFGFDWSYGRIFAVHLHPEGASYTGDYEVFLKGKPLNLTDLEFGKDGAMYFITGGRGTQSGLYRVSYVGSESVSRDSKSKSDSASDKAAAAARKLRHELEAFYGKKNPQAIDFAWPHLGSEDRFIRYAARIAIEWQDVPLWKDRALAETNADAGLNALLGLARCGPKDTQRDLLLALKKFPLDSLSLTQKLEKLRVIELSFIRQGKPDADLATVAIEKLDRLYPNENEYMNRELAQLLIFLEAPGVVAKTLALLDKAKTQEEQAHYMFYLRNLKTGWTLEQRKHYFQWFQFAREAGKGEVTYPKGSEYYVWANQQKAAERHPGDLLRWFKEAGREYGDGASYPKYLVAIRKEAVSALTEQDRYALGPLIDDANRLASFKLTKERRFVKEWTLADLESSLDEIGKGRSYQNGKAAFNDSQCILCHRFGDDGGSVGPELTAASSKYSRKDILESMLEPSKVISEQFQNYSVTTRDGESVTGRILDENDQKIVMQPSPLVNEPVDIMKADIVHRQPSKVSPMPQGLLDQLTKDEILDLIAYIESAGKEKASNFTQAGKK